jgi:hypothetical protein
MEVVEEVRRQQAELGLHLNSSLSFFWPRELVTLCGEYVLDAGLLFEQTLLLHCWTKLHVDTVFHALIKTGDVLWKAYLERLDLYVGKHYPKKTSADKFAHAMSIFQPLCPEYVLPCHRLECFYGREKLPRDDKYCTCGDPVWPTTDLFQPILHGPDEY